MSTTRKFVMPTGGIIGRVDGQGNVILNEAFVKYLGGIEDVSGRVSATLDPTTATAADIVNAMLAANQMKAE
jgi:hypothetical protein